MDTKKSIIRNWWEKLERSKRLHYKNEIHPNMFLWEFEESETLILRAYNLMLLKSNDIDMEIDF